MSTSLSPAENNEIETKRRIREEQRGFIFIGKLLSENKKKAYWSIAGRWESWHDYIESLGIGQRTAYLMIEAYSLQSVANISEEVLLEIGISKVQLLLPIARQGGLTEEIIEIAKSAPVNELKAILGHKISENDKEYSVQCPHCGVTIRGAKWVKKG